MDLHRLLCFGYFPKELPPPFTTVDFGEFAVNSGIFPNVPNEYTSRPGAHNLARPGNQRRALAILNPFNFHKIAKLMSDNAAAITAQLARSSTSITKPTIDPRDRRAYIPKANLDQLLRQRASIRSRSRFLLRTDISRFYSSIYTHSIPWAIHGKPWSKAHRTGGFANMLDWFVRNAQDGQTLGIPVGPDTSFVISEMVAASIDELIQGAHLNAYRFVDDFEFGFLTRAKQRELYLKLKHF